MECKTESCFDLKTIYSHKGSSNFQSVRLTVRLKHCQVAGSCLSQCLTNFSVATLCYRETRSTIKGSFTRSDDLRENSIPREESVDNFELAIRDFLI